MDRLLTGLRLAPASLLVAAGLFAAVPAAAGDAGKGRAVFAQQCAMCHSAARGGATILGPTLFGVVGRPVASVGGFAYSSGMKAQGGAWTADRLRAYLPAPRAMVPGTKMSFGGLKNPTQLDDLVTYLGSLK